MELVSFKEQLCSLLTRINRILKSLKDTWQLFLEEKQVIREREPGMEDHLDEAYREWKNAQKYFDNATEPELIDHASFLIGAAERKYMYLLRKYKEEKLKKLY